MIHDVMKLSVRYLEHCHFHQKPPQPFLTVYTPRGMHTFHQRCDNPYHVLPAVVFSRHLLDATEVYFSLPKKFPILKDDEPGEVDGLVIFSSQSEVSLAMYEIVGRQLAWSRIKTDALVLDEFFLIFMAAFNEPMPTGLKDLIRSAESVMDPWQAAFDNLKDRLDVDLAKSCNSHHTS